MLKIAIHYDGKYGFIKYDPESQEVLVTHPNSKVRDVVYKYLTTTRDFVTELEKPGKNHTGTTGMIYVSPTDSAEYVEMALCEMFFNIGVHVDWNNEHNQYPEDDNEDIIEKSQVLSVFGEDEYQIIN